MARKYDFLIEVLDVGKKRMSGPMGRRMYWVTRFTFVKKGKVVYLGNSCVAEGILKGCDDPKAMRSSEDYMNLEGAMQDFQKGQK